MFRILAILALALVLVPDLSAQTVVVSQQGRGLFGRRSSNNIVVNGGGGMIGGSAIVQSRGFGRSNNIIVNGGAAFSQGVYAAPAQVFFSQRVYAAPVLAVPSYSICP